ncbi:MAG TPA: glycosyltransferase [Verrucomicrobiae bacterium]|nr:glycosyltransferase [Verrucomicrobiae bacterium]
MNLILGLFATLSCGLALWQWAAARRFPLHAKTTDTSFTPAVSILKPLKGCDEATRESLQSWLRQNYGGPVQILFGVADSRDPVCGIVEQLLAENPAVDAQLIVCETIDGMNAKAAKLAQLEQLAKHELVVICDADVRVSADFLASFVEPLRDENTALVNCFYRLANPATIAMRWEAIAINSDFWSQVLQSQTLRPLDFALGAAILIRRKALAEIGGYRAIADCLADDYQLGNRIAKKGHRIALCPMVVECWDAPMDWTQVWRHQLRWARTIRVCQPLPYFFSLLSNASLWALLWLPVAFVTTTTFWAPLAALVFLLVRIIQAQSLQKQFTPERRLVSPLWLVPVKDVLQAALWLSAFAGDTVEWRGRKMKLLPNGTLVEQN